jgi:hypothetical protein
MWHWTEVERDFTHAARTSEKLKYEHESLKVLQYEYSIWSGNCESTCDYSNGNDSEGYHVKALRQIAGCSEKEAINMTPNIDAKWTSHHCRASSKELLVMLTTWKKLLTKRPGKHRDFEGMLHMQISLPNSATPGHSSCFEMELDIKSKKHFEMII